MSRRGGGAGGIYARVGLATVLGGAAVAALIARAESHDTVPGRQKVLARIRKAKGVAGLDKAAGNTSTSNAGLGELLGQPPSGVDWATSEPKVPEGLVVPPRMVIGTGAGRSAVPLTGSMKDWLTKSTGAHVSSIVDKAIRASPPLHKNTQADRTKDVAALNALVGQITNFDKLAEFLDRAGYTSTFGACDLSLKPGEPTRLSLKSSISGTTTNINTIDWVNRATHSQVQALITRLTKGGTDENSKRLAVMEKLEQNSFVNGFPRLATALKTHGFLNQGVPMTNDTNDTPLQLGNVVPITTEAIIVNGAAQARSAADSIDALADQAIASQPPDIDPEREAAYKALKSVSDTYAAAEFLNVGGSNLDVLLSHLDLIQWTHKQPDTSKLAQIPEKPLTITLFTQFNIPNQREWVQNATATSVPDFVQKVSDTTSNAFLRFQLCQLLLDPNLNAQFIQPPAAKGLVPGFTPQWQPAGWAKWAMQVGWLRENVPDITEVNPPFAHQGALIPSLFWRPRDTNDAAQVGTVQLGVGYAWQAKNGSDRPGESLHSMFEGPTLPAGAATQKPVGLAGKPGPADLTGGTGFAPVQPKAAEAAGVNYTSKDVLAAWTAAKAAFTKKANSVRS